MWKLIVAKNVLCTFKSCELATRCFRSCMCLYLAYTRIYEFDIHIHSRPLFTWLKVQCLTEELSISYTRGFHGPNDIIGAKNIQGHRFILTLNKTKDHSPSF